MNKVAVIHPSYSNRVIFVKKGEMGYYPCSRDFITMEDAEDWKKEYNRYNNISKAIEEAYLAGSLFGWDCPASNVENYDENGVFIKTKLKG